jgi:hypothetical protein
MESQVSGMETTSDPRPPIGSLRFCRPDRSQIVQGVADTESRAIVGVGVTTEGTDKA